MPQINDESRSFIMDLMKKFRNILLTGSHGVGKTTLIFDIIAELVTMGLLTKGRVKYYSCATLDPWVDLVGIPIPDKATNALKFFRPKDLVDAEVVICDEINRSHSKVQNSLLEMIQFKTINGQPLKHLKMVIAMQNPATKMYQVTDLDPALVDRFHARITLQGAPSIDFYKTKGIDEKVAMSLVEWWTEDLNDDARNLVTPRTLEAIGGLIRDKLNWKFALGDSLGVPLFQLESRLVTNCGISKYEGITLRKASDDLEASAELARTDRDYATHILKQIDSSKAATSWDAAEIIIALPDDFQMKLMQNAKWVKRMQLEWPKLHKSFHETDECLILHQKLKKVGGIPYAGVEDDNNDMADEDDDEG